MHYHLSVDRFIQLSGVGTRINEMIRGINENPYVITRHGKPIAVMVAPSILSIDQWCLHVQRATHRPPVITIPVNYITKHCARVIPYLERWQLVILTRHGYEVAILAHIDSMTIGITHSGNKTLHDTPPAHYEDGSNHCRDVLANSMM
jgi:PHD/YefM family antitoxin component YafN of YafNO toxin-antitoxin module